MHAVLVFLALRYVPAKKRGRATYTNAIPVNFQIARRQRWDHVAVHSIYVDDSWALIFRFHLKNYLLVASNINFILLLRLLFIYNAESTHATQFHPHTKLWDQSFFNNPAASGLDPLQRQTLARRRGAYQIVFIFARIDLLRLFYIFQKTREVEFVLLPLAVLVVVLQLATWATQKPRFVDFDQVAVFPDKNIATPLFQSPQTLIPKLSQFEKMLLFEF